MGRYSMTCPICGNDITVEYYPEDSVGIVEEYVNCTRCNYSDEFAYGSYRTSFGRYEFNYGYSLLEDNNAYTLTVKKIHKALFMAHRNWHKGLRKNYRDSND